MAAKIQIRWHKRDRGAGIGKYWRTDAAGLPCSGINAASRGPYIVACKKTSRTKVARVHTSTSGQLVQVHGGWAETVNSAGENEASRLSQGGGPRASGHPDFNLDTAFLG